MYLDLWNSRDGSNASSDHSCVFDLTQNPSFIAVMSKNGSLPTMRRNSKFWLPAKRRFIVPWELALMFGYPVCQETADSAGVQLDKCLAVYKSGTLGNAMCLPAIGLVLLATLSSAKMRSQ